MRPPCWEPVVVSKKKTEVRQAPRTSRSDAFPEAPAKAQGDANDFPHAQLAERLNFSIWQGGGKLDSTFAARRSLQHPQRQRDEHGAGFQLERAGAGGTGYYDTSSC